MPFKTRQNLPLFVPGALVEFERECDVFRGLRFLFWFRCRALLALRLGFLFALLFRLWLPLYRLWFPAFPGLRFPACSCQRFAPLFGVWHPLGFLSGFAPLFGLRLVQEKTGSFGGRVALFGARFPALRRLRFPSGRPLRVILLLVTLLLLAAASALVVPVPVTIAVAVPAVISAVAVVAAGYSPGDDFLRNRGVGGQGSVHGMRMIFHHRDLTGDQLLDIPQKFLFLRVAERQGRSTCARPTGTAYAMYIGFGYVG